MRRHHYNEEVRSQTAQGKNRTHRTLSECIPADLLERSRSKRLVVAGKITPTEEIMMVDPTFSDTSHESAADAIDAMPEPPHVPSSRFRGVYLYARTHKWQAQIRVGGKRKHIGYFRDEIEAAHAYDAAAREVWGDRAQTNFPVAALPETQDFSDWFTLGELDGEDGLPCNPLFYGCVTVVDAESYCLGWRAATNARKPLPEELFGLMCAAMIGEDEQDETARLDERESSIEFDHDFIRRGGA